MKYLLTSTLVLWSLICMGQTRHNHLQAEVEKRFSPTDSIHWTTVYQGFWNDFHPVQVILSYNGSQYHGTLVYETSQLRFDLVGEDMDDGIAILFEVDFASRHTAVIQGDFTDVMLTGKWINRKNNRVCNFTARARDVIPLQSFEPMAASFSDPGAQAHMILLVEAPDQLTGSIYLDDARKAQRISGGCRDIPCQQWAGEAYQVSGLTGSVMGNRTGSEEITISFRDLSGKSDHYRLREVTRLPLKMRTFAGFTGSIDLAYVDFGLPAFEEWVAQETAAWWQDATRELQQTEPDEWRLVDRQAKAWNGWIELGSLTPEVATGVLTLTGPHGTSSHPFVLNRSKGEMIPVRSFFRKSLDVDGWTQDIAAKERETLLTDDEKEFNNWLSEATFGNICFRREGLALLTDFDPVFGVAEILVPYDQIRDKIRKRGVLSQLMNL